MHADDSLRNNNVKRTNAHHARYSPLLFLFLSPSLFPLPSSQAYMDRHRADIAKKREEKERVEGERYIKEQQEREAQDAKRKEEINRRRAKLQAEADAWEAERARKKEERQRQQQEEEESKERAKAGEAHKTDLLAQKVSRSRRKPQKTDAFDDFFDECEIQGVRTDAKQEVSFFLLLSSLPFPNLMSLTLTHSHSLSLSLSP